MSAALDIDHCVGCEAVQICTRWNPAGSWGYRKGIEPCRPVPVYRHQVRCMRYLNERGYNGAYRKECVGCNLNVKDCPLGPVIKSHFNTPPLPGKKEEYLKKDGSGNWIQCDKSGRETEKSVSKIIDADEQERRRFMGKRLMQLYDDEARSLRAGFVPRFSVHERFAAEFGDNPKETLSKIINADEENKNRFRLRSLK